MRVLGFDVTRARGTNAVAQSNATYGDMVPRYVRPPQPLYGLPGWHQLFPSPVEGRIMTNWKLVGPLLTQAGASDRNAMLVDIQMREVT